MHYEWWPIWYILAFWFSLSKIKNTILATLSTLNSNIREHTKPYAQSIIVKVHDDPRQLLVMGCIMPPFTHS